MRRCVAPQHLSSAARRRSTSSYAGGTRRSAERAGAPGGFWGMIDRALGRFLDAVERCYARSLDWALAHPVVVVSLLLLTTIGTGEYVISPADADDPIVRRIVDAAELKPTDKVLEIGPGLGPLTELLLKSVGEVLAIEMDRRLVEVLQDPCTS